MIPLDALRQRARAIGRSRALRLALCALTVLWIAWRGFRIHVGSPRDALADAGWTSATRVLARDRRVLGERPSASGLWGRYTPIGEVSPRLVLATVASEDQRFYSHDGVDRRALVRALVTNVTHGRIVSGASSITTQLVKRVDHHGKPRPRTLSEKVREMARAMNLEDEVDKSALLEAYLNRLDYGHGYAGPEAAAQGYFGVRAADLSLAEATLLAVLPRAPSALDPYRHRDRAVRRQRALLETLRSRGLVSAEDATRALEEPLVFRDPKAPRPMAAAHVVLARARGGKPDRPLEVVTTLDLDLQRDVEAFVRAQAPRFRAKGASNAAVVVVDNLTSDVLAEVGNVDLYDAHGGAVDLVRAPRQPGSTLKPFVYARAFEGGVSPMRPLADVPTEFGSGGASYAPENFDGSFVGPISAREALAGSLNVPAVQLASEIGAAGVIDVLRGSGLRLRDGAKRYGLSIALGSGEVTPRELAEAYATLARGGEHLPLRSLATDPRAAPEHVFATEATALVAEALSDPVARIRGLRTRGPFDFTYPVAVKTGTSSGFRDAWTTGYTRERTVVVWVGNADGAPTQKLTGAVGAGPLFFEVMKRAMRDVHDRRPLFDATGLETASVCPLSGLRATSACTDQVTRSFLKGRAPDHACNMHVHARATSGPTPYRCEAPGPGTRPVVVLPAVFDSWLAASPPGVPGADPHGLPWLSASRTAGCVEASVHEPRVVLVAPRDGSIFSLETGPGDRDVVDVAAETLGLAHDSVLEVVVDGHPAARLPPPYRTRVHVGRGDHLVEVRPADERVAALLGRAEIRVR